MIKINRRGNFYFHLLTNINNYFETLAFFARIRHKVSNVMPK